MRIWTSEHTFNHDWTKVVEAAWRKYPNPVNPAVTGIDVLDRQIDENGVLRTSRLMRTEWRVPNWVTGLIGLENPSFAYEYSEVDAQAKRMTLRARNLSCANFVCVDETLVYQPHPEDPTRTLLEQSAVITVRGVPLGDRMESLMASTISTNAGKGRQAMEWVISAIRREYDLMSEKLSTECVELSHKIAQDANEIAASAKRGLDELRRGFEEAGVEARRNSFSKASAPNPHPVS